MGFASPDLEPAPQEGPMWGRGAYLQVASSSTSSVGRTGSRTSHALRVAAAVCAWPLLALLAVVAVVARARVESPQRHLRWPWKKPLLGLASFPGPWRICPDAGHCDPNLRQRWDRPPSHVAGEVQDGLLSLGGVPKKAYDPVASHWRQHPPHFRGKPVSLEDIAKFMRQLLYSNPFGTDLDVPYLDFKSPGGGKTVAITQKQLAFLVANALMGNSIQRGEGLSAMLKRCSARPNTPRAYLRSLLSLLAVLSQELADPQAQGTMIVAATPIQGVLGASGWRAGLGNQTLQEPTVCSEVPGQVPTCSAQDFMEGGNRFQALTDIAGTVVGGGGDLCEVANTQDESLVHFYSEVLALAFFVGPGLDGLSMLPVPMAFLGVRRYLSDIRGQNSAGPPFFNLCGSIRETDWLNEDIKKAGTAPALVDGLPATLAASSFVAVASASSMARGGCSVGEAMNNLCSNQRNHLDEDLSAWYGAFSASQYGGAVQQAFRQIVRSIGTGPWGAGVWFGDSQQYFLVVWLATSLLAGLSLDYYVYDHFCENPANQCFLLGGQPCGDCIERAKVVGSSVDSTRCGQANIWDIIETFKGRPVQDLYGALRGVGGPPTQVFDLLCSSCSMRFRPPPASWASRQAGTQSGPGEENLYLWDPEVGGWGGICTCPDGRRYEVGDNNDGCKSLACEFGESGPCTSFGINPKHVGMKVTCAREANSTDTTQDATTTLAQAPAGGHSGPSNWASATGAASASAPTGGSTRSATTTTFAAPSPARTASQGIVGSTASFQSALA